MINLDHIKAMLGAITQGEWIHRWNRVYADDVEICAFYDKDESEFAANAAFIAASPRIVRDLVAEVEALAEAYAQLAVEQAGDRSEAYLGNVQDRIKRITDVALKGIVKGSE